MTHETAGEGSTFGDGFQLTRRGVWTGAGMLAAAAVAGRGFDARASETEPLEDHPGYDAAFPEPGAKTAADFPVSENTRKLSTYISEAAGKDIPAEVAENTKWHLLDTLAAIVAGSQTPAGIVSRRFVADLGSKQVASVMGSPLVTDAMTAAMANGTMGHGHEIDDTGGASGPWHPGINVIPAALALGEQFNVSGTHFLRAVTLGYDIGGRVGTAAGLLRNFRTPTVSTCGYFGAAAAAACVSGLNEEQVRYALSYTAQQSSGIDSFRRDPDHIEKGFLNGGLGARGGVTSAMLVLAGFTGVRDIFTGPASFFALFKAAGQDVNPLLMTEGLGKRFDVLETGFKRRPVAGAISAVIDSLEVLLAKQKIDHRKVREITVRYEPYSVTDNAGSADVNVQHAVAMMLVDGQLTFRAIQDRKRFSDPALVRLRSITKIAPITIYVRTGKYMDPSTPGRAAALGSKLPVIQIRMNDGTVFSQGDVAARGEGSRPFTREWAVEKSNSLMSPVLGAAQTASLIDLILNIEKVENVTAIARLLRTKGNVDGAFSEWPLGTKM